MKTYTLCGSMRFEKEMQEIAYYLETQKGFNILQCVYVASGHEPSEEDLMALLLKTPILDDFSEEDNSDFIHKKEIEMNLFKKYVNEYKTDRGILLKRRLYGIVAKK